jgi:hypothetical protein
MLTAGYVEVNDRFEEVIYYKVFLLNSGAENGMGRNLTSRNVTFKIWIFCTRNRNFNTPYLLVSQKTTDPKPAKCQCPQASVLQQAISTLRIRFAYTRTTLGAIKIEIYKVRRVSLRRKNA